MIYEQKSIKEFLKAELQERVDRNPRYSLRSFAKALDIHAAELSLVLRGERSLSYNSSQKVIKNLSLSPSQTKYFIELLQLEKNGISFAEPSPHNMMVSQQETQALSLEKFQNVSRWYHFAILNLMSLKNFEWTPSHIAKRLGVTQIEAGLAMQDLLQAGLVQARLSNNKKFKGKKKLNIVKVETTLPSSTIKKYHAEVLKKASEALLNVPMELREFQSIGLSISLAELPKLKKQIDEFTDTVIEKYHKDSSTDVYQMEICLFPLTQIQERKSES